MNGSNFWRCYGSRDPQVKEVGTVKYVIFTVKCTDTVEVNELWAYILCEWCYVEIELFCADQYVNGVADEPVTEGRLTTQSYEKMA